MRVLIIPELYRPEDASANATLNDAVAWVRDWLHRDPTIHVYWLLPRRETANYEHEYVLADRDSVTLLEADPLMADVESESPSVNEVRTEMLFTESGYSGAELNALKRGIYDRFGYVDVVIDQLRFGRADLVKWLLYLSGHRGGEPKPFDVIVNVHDLRLPFKYQDDGCRSEYHRKREVADAVFADGCWFKARSDAEKLPGYATEFLRDDLVEEALDAAVMTDSPIDFDRFEEQYATAPEWLHVAGSTWDKKCLDVVMDIAADLHRRFGIGTIFTSMDEIPQQYVRQPWIETYPEASRAQYERMLRKGDIAVCATEYDTLARTWFEQAASGQVLVVRNEPWVRECVPEGSPLLAPADQLHERARWVVGHWEEAVAANQRLVECVREIRSPERSGRKTLEDMQWRTEDRVEQYAAVHRRHDQRMNAIQAVIRRADSQTLALDELNDLGAQVTRDGKPLLDHDWCSITDLVFTLRARGYRDIGNGGTPVFRHASARTSGVGIDPSIAAGKSSAQPDSGRHNTST